MALFLAVMSVPLSGGWLSVLPIVLSVVSSMPNLTSIISYCGTAQYIRPTAWEGIRRMHGANMKPLLIVYYSRSGYTRRVAQALADSGHADLEELRPIRDYPGTAGIIRALWDTLLNRQPALEPLHHCPADYQTVLIGGPIWAGRMAAPVRSFVATYGQGCKRLASFCTMAGSGGDAVFDAIARLAGKPLVWRAALSDSDIERGAHLDHRPGSKGCLNGLFTEPQRS